MIRRILSNAGVVFAKRSTIEQLTLNNRLLNRNAEFPNFANSIDTKLLRYAISLLPHSKSEIFQDIFAAIILQDVKTGYFVEFGATDGIEGSNSWLFEKYLGWSGLLAEPARKWHPSLRKNREVAISTKCVWSKTGVISEFVEAKEGGLSTLRRFVDSDRYADRRLTGKKYNVETISLNDLLKQESAPRHIDFMSIDTEGSEFEILAALDLDYWSFGVISVEHNFRPERELTHSLLARYGYKRAPASLSKFDDWYISTRFFQKIRGYINPCLRIDILNLDVRYNCETISQT